MHSGSLNLQEVIVFLVAAGVVVPLVRRLGISPVLGFLAVGFAIGPFGLARFIDELPWLAPAVISDPEGVRALAELGVVFLLFMIGLELSIERLWAMRGAVFGLGGAQVVVTAAVIFGIASLFDNSPQAAIILGAGFALSSTAIVMQLLAENRRLGTTTGQTAFAVLLLQDLAVLPILFLVGALAARDQGSVALALGSALGQAALAVAVILLTGRLVIRPLFRIIGSTASREMFLATVLLVIIGTALATEKAGLSMALGAFLAGLLFGETEYRHEIEVDIEPFKGLLLGLFFVSVGMGIDLSQSAAKPLWLAASVVGLFLIKGVIFYVLARLAKRPPIVALEAALLLGQAGEFGFLVIGLASGLGLLPDATAQFMLIVTGLTMVVTPFVAQGARRLARRLEARAASKSQESLEPASRLSGHIVVVGYGRVGQLLGSLLEDQELAHLAVDIDSELVGQFRHRGAGVLFGDARRTEMLRKLGIERAGALVVTMDSASATERVVEVARDNWPHLPIYVRARDQAHATRLISNGATHVIPETVEASLQLSEMVLAGAGIPEEAARHLIEVRRQAEQAALDESRPGDPAPTA